MIPIKTDEEVRSMAEGGKITQAVLQELLKQIKAGAIPLEIEKTAGRLIKRYKAKPSFKTVKGYHWATCICVNDVVVHGIPTEKPLQEGDLVGIDLGVFYKGFHTDASWTVSVGKESKMEKAFLTTGQEALKKAVSKARVGNRVGDLSLAIEETIKEQGFSPVRALIGHGIGRNLHEDPEIPCFLKGKVENTPVIQKGMTFAVEVIYNQGGAGVVYKGNDAWTIITKDGKKSALFEETVAVTQNGPWVLTRIA